MNAAGVCWSCGSNNVTEFETIIQLYAAPKNGLGEPILSAWPKIVMCSDCGYTRFRLSATELKRLTETITQH
jgi:predicted nucleic-acid-binding Zn-ribbon protein